MSPEAACRRAAAAAIAALSLFTAAVPAAAAPSRVPLGKASILFETTIWRAVVGPESVTFTCIAADCTGQPHVFATLSSGRDLSASIAAARRDGRPIRDDGVPPLPFPAISHWSGCRAMDEPILFAAGQVNGQGYVFTTVIASGCNFGSAMPESRFVELIRGFETN